MKKKKLLALTLALSLILLVSYAAVPVRNECSKDEHCPGGMRCLLHPNGFLVCRVPGPGEEINFGPNGGYISRGNRTSLSGSEFELIKVSSGIKVSLGFYPSSSSAIEAAVSMGISYEIEAFCWVEYNCDKTDNDLCVVCNRYRV